MKLVSTLFKTVTTLILGSLLCAPDVQAQTSTWSQMPTPNPSAHRNLLRGISAISSTEVWAVGEYQTSPQGLFQFTSENLAMKWDGTSWTTYPTPNPGFTSHTLWDVAAISSNNVWAVGDYSGAGGGAQPQLLHWDGSSWTHQTIPNQANTSFLWSVHANSASDIWAVGGRVGDPNGPSLALALHYNGSAWAEVPVPPVGQRINRFYAVHGLSANDVWAVGRWGHSVGSVKHLAMHWDGSSWTNVALPASLDTVMGSLQDVRMVAPNDVWAVGDILTGGMVMLHWDGTSWTEVPSSGGGGAFAPLAPNDIYAVGSEIMHWNGTAWTEVDSLAHLPGPALIDVTVLPNGEIWAAGRNIDLNSNFYTLVYRYSADSTQLLVTASQPTVPAGTAVQLMAQPTVPGNYTYRWSALGGNPFSDSTAANPTVTPTQNTTYVVSMTNATGYSVQGQVRVMIGGMVAAEQPHDRTELSAWPNPFENRLQLQLNAATNEQARITVTDALGRTVYAAKATLQPGENQLLLHLPEQASGLYQLKVQTDTQAWQTKLLRQ